MHGNIRRCYENSENVDAAINWFGIVETSCSTNMYVGIIANNKYPVYFPSQQRVHQQTDGV